MRQHANLKPETRNSKLAAFILAGGKSSRMGGGKDKASLRLAGQTLLEIMRAKAGTLTDRVFIVGGKQKFGPAAIEDAFPNRGPLAGIHAALRSSPADLNLMLAVDLPFIEPAFLQYLASQAETSPAVVTVPRTAAGWQPLCAIYRRSFADAAEQALTAGRNKIDALFSAIPLRVIDEQELKRASFSPEIFANLNTPEDFGEAKERFARSEEGSAKR